MCLKIFSFCFVNPKIVRYMLLSKQRVRKIHNNYCFQKSGNFAEPVLEIQLAEPVMEIQLTEPVLEIPSLQNRFWGYSLQNRFWGYSLQNRFWGYGLQNRFWGYSLRSARFWRCTVWISFRSL